MNKTNVAIILTAVEIHCPLCKYTCRIKSNCYKSRSRYNLRNHLYRHHTDAEVAKYVKTIL